MPRLYSKDVFCLGQGRHGVEANSPFTDFVNTELPPLTPNHKKYSDQYSGYNATEMPSPNVLQISPLQTRCARDFS
jgi:hypothetical protein